ncbi:MAG: extracellular solute-binding protein [Oscillospiraceae bacterium]|nr:extracellular solute-binding protein [Oscillospiraceae bacterium]
MRKLLSLFLIILLLFTTTAGCKSVDESTDNDMPPEHLNRPQYTSFPDLSSIVPNIDNIVLAGDLIYFSSSEETENNSLFLTNKIYRINADGTNLVKLPNYADIFELPPDAQSGGCELISVCIDNDGNLWVAEIASFYVYDLPSDIDINTATQNQLEQYRRLLSRQSSVRKLDSTGVELQTIDLSEETNANDFFVVESLCLSSKGDVYVATNMSVDVFDAMGNKLFKLANQGFAKDMMRLSDGNVAVPGRQGSNVMLRVIDADVKAWGETITISGNAYRIFLGNDEFPLVFIDGDQMYGIDAKTNEAVSIFNFLDAGIIPGVIENVVFIPDGRIMLTNRAGRSSGDTYTHKTELHVLDIAPKPVIPGQEIIELTLAVRFNNNELRRAVAQYNAQSSTHKINIVEYHRFEKNDAFFSRGSVDKLAMEIITGNAPDIIDVSFVPYSQWVSRGVFVDLYPLIDADPELRRSDFLESVLNAVEIKGGLYQIFPSFGISTMVSRPSIVGENMGWTVEEMISLIEANPGADWPMGAISSSSMELSAFTRQTMENYVDWVSGTAHFDRGDFVKILEYFGRYPLEWSLIDFDDPKWHKLSHELFDEGKKLMSSSYFYSFMDFELNRDICGGDFVFKGYPTVRGVGNHVTLEASFAITSGCKDVQAAWEFIRIFLTEKSQRERENAGVHFFPINKVVFNEEMARAVTDADIAFTQQDADQVIAMLSTVTYSSVQSLLLEEIIYESAFEYFSGRITAQDAARIIQSRASIFMSEQAG